MLTDPIGATAVAGVLLSQAMEHGKNLTVSVHGYEKYHELLGEEQCASANADVRWKIIKVGNVEFCYFAPRIWG